MKPIYKNMKILHIVPAYFPALRYGGPIESVHKMNMGLVRGGAKITVYTTNIDGKDVLNVPLNQEIDVDGVKVFYFPISFRPWKYSFALHRALTRNAKDFDLIHITSVFLSASTLGAYYAKKFNKPYIISPRGNFMEEPLKFHSLKKKIYVNLIEKRNLANADAVHFAVEKEKEDYLKFGLSLKKSIIIPNGIDFGNDVSAGFINNFREKFKIIKDAKIILFMGRLHKIKGLDTLIPAFSEVVKKESKAVLVIAGPDEGNYKKEIELEIKNQKLEINNNVVFTGMLMGDNKKMAYKEANIFVLPSYSENFSMATAEAMANSLPVIITKGVGISGEIEKAGAGIVIEKNEKQLTDAILKILSNIDLAKKMGENGKKLVIEEFSLDKITKKWIEEYREIINTKNL